MNKLIICWQWNITFNRVKVSPQWNATFSRITNKSTTEHLSKNQQPLKGADIILILPIHHKEHIWTVLQLTIMTRRRQKQVTLDIHLASKQRLQTPFWFYQPLSSPIAASPSRKAQEFLPNMDFCWNALCCTLFICGNKRWTLLPNPHCWIA